MFMLLDKGKNKKCFITGKKFSETKAKKHVETTLSQLLFILNLLTMPLCVLKLLARWEMEDPSHPSRNLRFQIAHTPQLGMEKGLVYRLFQTIALLKKYSIVISSVSVFCITCKNILVVANRVFLFPTLTC